MQLFYPLRSGSEKDSIITNYDSVNALTHHNNHYTLLYPDLVQELSDLMLPRSNIHTNISHSLGSLACGIDTSASFNSSLNTSLHPREILFLLQIVSLYQSELSKGNASITYPSLKLAKLLGVDVSCDAESVLDVANMRATILKMTAKLESLGLLKVFRRKRKNGMDMANKLIPVLPDRLHTRIKDSPSNLKVSDSSKLDHESNLEHILRTKLFVPIELDFMKSLFKNNLPSKYKLFFLNCIISAYRNFRHNSSDSDILSFSATSLELMKKNNISRSTLDRIFRYVKQQGDSFFLKVEHKYTKSDDIDCNRYDKSIFVISINPLVFHISQKWQSQTEEISNFDCDELQDNDLPIFLDTYEDFKTAWSKKQPSIIKKTALNNKEEIIKNKYSRNIDENLDKKNEELAKNNQIKPQTFLQTSNSEHLESEPCSLSSKSLKNSVKDFIDALPPLSNTNNEDASRTIQDISDRKNKLNIPNNFNVDIPKKTAFQPKAINDRKHQDFRYFYPISEKDAKALNFKANREFGTSFTNQLLLKLYIKYPEKRFKNKFTFWNYMIKALKKEQHQGPLVNNPSFRFSCNIGNREKNLLEYEKYLNHIENSLDTSKEMCVKKKIAGRFSTEVAYKILMKVQFKTNDDNSFITALIPSHIALSERQIAYLSEQLEAVFGINGYYVTVLGKDVNTVNVGYSASGRRKGERKEEIEGQYSKIKEPDIISSSKDIRILDIGKESDKIEENTVWNQIRKGLREELGEAIDEVWFSKAVAKECRETGALTLTMPTRFMSDWIRNNYSHVIRRLAIGIGVKGVEYKFSR